MSQQLINLNSDLKKLRDNGYEVEIISGYLVLKNIPYVNACKEIKHADLISELTLAGDKTARPNTHVAYFTGEHPCDYKGNPLNKIVNGHCNKVITEGMVARHSFSSKPPEGYKDYYIKMTTYVAMVSSHAEEIDGTVNAQTFAPTVDASEHTIFNYVDTASSRANIIKTTKRLELHKIAIIGIGGTGSYILDFIAKTPVQEIHLYDKDKYFSHNAFRSPGAPSLDELRTMPSKVDYFKSIYSKMHKGIIAHNYDIDENTIEELKEMDFVFISIDAGNQKKIIFDKLEYYGISFIDVGIGIYHVEDSNCLGGILRVTTSTDYKRDHAKKTVSFAAVDGIKNEYSTNIQVADLNALNAIYAVIKWKKMLGFYLDLEKEHSSTYTIDGNKIDNDEKP